jgi:16S rRNA (cytosine1402-N4)-methyltransferase
VDQDEEVLQLAKLRLSKYGERVIFIRDNFRNIDHVLKRYKEIGGLLYDLGAASYQLEQKERGFSFLRDGPLDMRMNRRSSLRAADLVNNLPEVDLAKLIKKYGEERWAYRIAKEIVKFRRTTPIETTQQLTKIIESAIPHGRGRIHPATRTFQALRIAVNKELEALEESLEKAIPLLREGARLILLSFHSGEDRVVKRIFKKWAARKKLTILTKKPITPTVEEVKMNPRARSAKLRAAEVCK